MSGGNIDITKNIQMIESLKNRLLVNITELFLVMSGELNETNDENSSPADIFADLIISSYLLADKIGYSFDLIDVKMLRKMKLTLLNEQESKYSEQLLKLSRHLDKFSRQGK